MNLALEEALVRCASLRAGRNILRIWRNMKAVVIGRFQCARLEADLKACADQGIEIVRRFSGGGAVYQDQGNLNYSLIVRKTSLGGVLSQADFNSLILKGVVEALSYFGVSATSDAGRSVLIGEKKLSGIAGFANSLSYFGHGTLLVNSKLQLIREVLTQVEAENIRGPVRSVPSPVINLCTLTSLPITMDKVKSGLIAGFEKVFGAEAIIGKLSSKERELAKRLYKEKYQQEVCSPTCPVRRCLTRSVCPYTE